MRCTNIIALQLLTSAAIAIPFWPHSLSSNAIKSNSSLPEIQVVGVPLSHTSNGPSAETHYLINRAATPVPADYTSQVLTRHNVHRQNHTVVNMTYSASLASYAQTLASSCSYGHNTTIGGGGYGQNIAAIGSSASNYGSKSASTVAAYAITEQWYNSEVNNFLASYYGQASPDMSKFASWGHFTQVVWKGSAQVGCATQYCPAGTIFGAPFTSWYTVCNYSPPGNYMGQFGTNVLKPTGAKTAHVTV